MSRYLLVVDKHKGKDSAVKSLNRSSVIFTDPIQFAIDYTDKLSFYMKAVTCRETLLTRLRMASNEIASRMTENREHGYNVSFNLVATGQKYTNLYKKIKSKKGSLEILEYFINDIFNVNVEISFIPVPNISEMASWMKYIHSMVINIPYQRTPPAIVYSAILSILKEPEISERIISGKITTKKQLIKELVGLASRRQRGEDVSIYNKKLGYSKVDNGKYLLFPFNHNGTDWISILYLALFIFLYNNRLVLPTITLRMASNGPINSVKEGRMSEMAVREFIRTLGRLSYNQKLTLYLASRVNSIFSVYYSAVDAWVG